MEVNQEVLKKLICSVCKEHLSIGPVILLKNMSYLQTQFGVMIQQNNIESVCGRCAAPDASKEVALRNLPYEHLAEQLLFPCRYAKHGCTVKCVFGEALKHEEECEFQQLNCCISETSTCKWIGTKDELLQHCNDTHPQHVVENPATFEYDIFKSSVNNYLMTAFHMLFLIHTKVCLTSKKIYHCVRLLGDSGNIGNVDYSLMLTKEDNKVTKKGVVAKQGCLAIKDDDSLAIGINNLLGFFTNFKGTIFTLTINSLIEKSEPQMNVKELYCCQCDTNVTYTTAYVDKGKWFCSTCIDNKHVCSYAGCSFMETNNKIKVHEIYCSYGSGCPICCKKIGLSLEQHCQVSHTDITYLSGEIFTTQFSRRNTEQLFITSDFGRLHCQHGLRNNESEFYINVFSPIGSGNLRWYTCEVQLHNPATELTLRKILPLFDHETNENCDWQLKITEEDILQYVYSGDNEFKMAVTITKTS